MKSQYFLITLVLLSIYFLQELFSPYLKTMLVALLLAVATNSLNIYFQKKLNKFIAASIMTIILTAIFFIPVLYCILSFATLINKIDQNILISIFDSVKLWVNTIPNDLLTVKEYLIKALEKINIPELIQELISFGAYVGKNSASFIIDMFMILVFYFFSNFYGKELSIFLKEALPLSKEDTNTLFYESSNVMSVVLYSILVTAIFEGLLFGIFISFFSYDGILLGVLYGFASLIPIVGGLIMWLPLAIYELYAGNITNAIIIASYSLIVISIFADTFVKPIIIKYINQKIVKTPTALNEILIFFSIIAGLSSFGFWGMIIGPATVTFFISIIQLLKKHSKEYK
ncbi:MAG: AI-2E family transporter [Campylobacteraceae bacterium]|nr:AI-2E family transporter [Campylobacteraceae bacterium]